MSYPNTDVPLREIKTPLREILEDLIKKNTFHASAFDELTVTVPAPVSAPTLAIGVEGWEDFDSGHTYDFVQTYVGWNGETQASSVASITVSYRSRIGVLPTAPKATRAVGAKIYCRVDGGAWHLVDIAFLTAAADSRIIGFAKPAAGGIVVNKNASGAAPPGSNTATDRDGTAISNPATAPILTVIGGMPPSTTFYGAISYTAQDGTESALSAISSGITTSATPGGRFEMGHPGSSPPNGAVLINYYLGTSATAGAMKKQLTVGLKTISPRIETYNASGAAHSAGAAQSTISGFQQALDAAVASGSGASVVGPVSGQSNVPIIFRVTAHGIKVQGLGTSGFVTTGKSSISYEGAISGIDFVIYSGFGWSVEGIEFTDPHNRVIAGLAYASITGGGAFVAKWTECTFQAYASGGVAVHAPNEGRYQAGSHQASEQTFERCAFGADAWGVKLHSNQSGNFIFSDCYCSNQGHSGSADSGDIYVGACFGNSLFNFTAITGAGAYLYYLGAAPTIGNAWGASSVDLLIERNYSETGTANCDIFVDATAGAAVSATLLNNRLQNASGHERIAVCTHGPAKIIVIGRLQSGNILFTNPNSFLDASGGMVNGYFKQPTPTFPPAGDTAGYEMLTNGPIALINKDGDKAYVSINDSGDIVLTPKTARGVTVPDDAYDAATWNGSLAVPTKNALRDKIEALITAIAAGYQPLDSDLTTITGLTATTDNFLVAVASAWASRTPAQVKTTLALNNVPNTDATNASNISSGTLADGRLSSNVPLKNGANTFTAAQLIQNNTPPQFTLKDTGGGNVGFNFEPTGSMNVRMVAASNALIVYDLTNAAYRWWLDSNGNLGLNQTSFGTSAAKVLAMADGTAPGSSPANAIQLWSQSGEMKVRDSSGNVTTLSPHAGDAPEWMYDKEDVQPPHISREANMFAGTIRFVNHTRAARLQQLLFDGQSLPEDPLQRRTIHEETFEQYNDRVGLHPEDAQFLTQESWEKNEALNDQAREQERARWREDRRKVVREGLRQRLARGDTAAVPPEFRFPEPEPYPRRSTPAWLKQNERK